MQTPDPQLPVFVYGTLRSGQGNYRHILDGRTERKRSAVLHGYKLLDAGVPFAVLGEECLVVGEVMDVQSQMWETVLNRLDHLEEYTGREDDSLYVRVVRRVTLEDGSEIKAYVYLASQSTCRLGWIHDAPEVPGGDWMATDAA